FVETLTATEVAGNRDAVARARVRASQGPAAHSPVQGHPLRQHVVDDEGALPVTQLSDVVVVLLALDASGARPPEQQVTRSLHRPLALDDTLAVVVLLAPADEAFEHGGLGFLDLQEQWVVIIGAEEQRDPATRSDASHAHDLPCQLDEAIRLEQG